MPFKKGQKKAGGRKAGTPNKNTVDMKRQIKALVEDKFDQVNAAFELLDPKDQVGAYLKFLEYVVPKQRETKLDISTLSEEEIDTLLNQALNKLDKEE